MRVNVLVTFADPFCAGSSLLSLKVNVANGNKLPKGSCRYLYTDLGLVFHSSNLATLFYCLSLLIT